MICMLSKHAAIDGGYGDALMLDYRGYVAEATGANVFFVSGMREFLGAKNVSVPVSRLAKYKTTLQLIALAILLAEPMMPGLRLFSDLVLWSAAALTVWTGWSYWKGMAVHLKDAAK
jgi:phosphatidylglycerophosphate synthase